MEKMKANKQTLIIGAAVLDILVKVDNLPRTGEDATGDLQKIAVGGCAYNVSRVMSALGGGHVLLAPIGKGLYADIIKADFAKHGIEKTIEEDSGDNGWDVSFIEKSGERTFLTIPGIEKQWKASWFDQIDVEIYDYIYVSGYELEGDSGPVILEALKKRKPDSRLLFDASPRVSYIDRELLDEIMAPGTLIHCNRDEMNALAPSADSVENAAETLYARTHNPVVITLGDKGCYFRDSKDKGFVPGNKINVADTIGAGDAHCAGLICALSAGSGTREAARFANGVAAKVAGKHGGA